MTSSKRLLTLAGYLCAGVAIFQFSLTFFPSLGPYFGAPEKLLSSGVWLYAASIVVTALFGLIALYAFSGAGRIRRLPLLRTGLVLSGSLYTLRGLLLIQEMAVVFGLVNARRSVPPQELVSSFVALSIGLIYLAGTCAGWQSLKPVALHTPRQNMASFSK